MRTLLLVFFLVLIVLGETSVLPFFPLFGKQPNLLLIALLALQFEGLRRESYYGAFLGGILLDLWGGRPLGLSSLVLLLLVKAAGLVRRVAAGSFLLLLGLTFLSAAVFRAVYSFPTFYPSSFLKGGLLDVGVMAVLYPTLRYFLKNVFGRREIEVGV